MASKTKTRATKKAREFDLLLPRLARAEEGEEFAPGNYVRKTGTVPALLVAVRMSGSPLGVHAAAKGSETSLCGLAISNPDVKASGQAAKVAPHVTCRYCQARLVGAGVLSSKAETTHPYAADYGTRDLESELKALAKEEAAATA